MGVIYTKEEYLYKEIEKEVEIEITKLYGVLGNFIDKLSSYKIRFAECKLTSLVISNNIIDITYQPYDILNDLLISYNAIYEKYNLKNLLMIYKDGIQYKVPLSEKDRFIYIVAKLDKLISTTGYGYGIEGEGTYLETTVIEYVNSIDAPHILDDGSVLAEEYLNTCINELEHDCKVFPRKYLGDIKVSLITRYRSEDVYMIQGNNYKYIFNVWRAMCKYHMLCINKGDSCIELFYDGRKGYIPKIVIPKLQRVIYLFNYLITETDYVAEVMHNTPNIDIRGLYTEALSDADSINDKGDSSVIDKLKDLTSNFFNFI